MTTVSSSVSNKRMNKKKLFGFFWFRERKTCTQLTSNFGRPNGNDFLKVNKMKWDFLSSRFVLSFSFSRTLIFFIVFFCQPDLTMSSINMQTRNIHDKAIFIFISSESLGCVSCSFVCFFVFVFVSDGPVFEWQSHVLSPLPSPPPHWQVSTKVSKMCQ